MVQVFDDDDAHNPSLAAHDRLGQCAPVALGSLLQEGAGMTLPLAAGGRGAEVRLVAEEMVGSQDVVEFKCRGLQLANMGGWFGTSDPFLRISRAGLQRGAPDLNVWQARRGATLQPARHRLRHAPAAGARARALSAPPRLI